MQIELENYFLNIMKSTMAGLKVKISTDEIEYLLDLRRTVLPKHSVW